jgi:hypothetical protein
MVSNYQKYVAGTVGRNNSAFPGNRFRTVTQKSRNGEGVLLPQRHQGFAGEKVMRAIVFIVAFVLAFGGVSVDVTADNPPNAGLFSFNAAPVDAPTVVASR